MANIKITRDGIEFTIKRVLVPVVGLGGILYEEIVPPIDVPLIIAYIAMLGLAGPAIVDTVLTTKGGGETK